MSYAKLDSGIVESSIWSEPCATRVVWVTFLAKKDHTGKVAGSRSGMIRACNVSPDEFDAAVSCLESPDKDSRTMANEGRRIARVEGGWMVLNHALYRDKTHSAHPESVRKANYRQKLRDSGGTERDVSRFVRDSGGTTVSVSVFGSVSGSEKQLPKTRDPQDPDGTFERFWSAYPSERHLRRQDALMEWSHIRDKPGVLAACLAALSWQRHSDDWRRGFIPMPMNYLEGKRWQDEPPRKEKSATSEASRIPAATERALRAWEHSTGEALSSQVEMRLQSLAAGSGVAPTDDQIADAHAQDTSLTPAQGA
jgi:hypothetical protein